jgi:primosomal protein DnaI
MKKIEYSNLSAGSSAEETKAAADVLKKDPAVLAVFAKNNIPAGRIDTHTWKIYEWRKQFEPCCHCQGLEHCGQKQKGFFMNLNDDGILHSDISACKYQRILNQAEAHLALYLVSDLPKDLRTVSFEGIDPASSHNDTKEYERVFVSAKKAADAGESLFLSGSMGVGKTYLAACAANQYARSKKNTAFIHYPTFTQRMVAGIKTGEYRIEMKRLCYADFLVIDDIGAESVTEWNRDQILLPILNQRYENHLTTWFTSNDTLETLKIHFRISNRGKDEEYKAARIIERISAMCSTISFAGSQSVDRRL